MQVTIQFNVISTRYKSVYYIKQLKCHSALLTASFSLFSQSLLLFAAVCLWPLFLTRFIHFPCPVCPVSFRKMKDITPLFLNLREWTTAEQHGRRLRLLHPDSRSYSLLQTLFERLSCTRDEPVALLWLCVLYPGEYRTASPQRLFGLNANVSTLLAYAPCRSCDIKHLGLWATQLIA